MDNSTVVYGCHDEWSKREQYSGFIFKIMEIKEKNNMIKHDPFSILKSQNTGIWILHKLIKYQSRILTLLLIGVIALVISMSSFSRVQFAQHQHAQMRICKFRQL